MINGCCILHLNYGCIVYLYDIFIFHTDVNEAKAALSEAQSSVASASTDEAKAEAQIAVEVAEEVVKACSA